jgi:hypothetical protein
VITTTDFEPLANRFFVEGSRNQLLATSTRQNRRARRGFAIPRVRKLGKSRLGAS